jgi:hypothetical protein
MRRNGLVSRSALAARPSVLLLLLRTSMCCVVTPISSRRRTLPRRRHLVLATSEPPALYCYPGAFSAIQTGSLAIACW